MSFGTPAVKNNTTKEWAADYYYMPTWTRNSNWLAMPVLPDTTQQINILYAVFDNSSNYVAFTVTATGTTTVDWGDGTSNTYATGVLASHQYSFSNTTLTTTSEVYKQGMIVITNSGNITGFTMTTRPTGFSVANFPMNMLDIQIIGPSLSTIQFASTQVTTTVATRFPLCEHINLQKAVAGLNIGNGFFSFPKLTQADFGPTVTFSGTSQLFYQCYSLITVNGLVKSNNGANTQMFSACESMVMAPVITYAAGTGTTTADNMFGGCISLKYFPPNFSDNVGSATGSTTAMFTGCSSLENAPWLNLAAVTNTQNMFLNCYSLKTLPSYNISNVNTGANMFQNCSSLTTIPPMNFSKFANASSVFSGCAAIREFPALDFSASTSFSATFSGCRALVESPRITSSNTLLTTCAQMFQNCSNLKVYNPFAMGAVTTTAAMFLGCSSIRSFPSGISSTNLNALTILTQMFSGCSSMTDAPSMTIPAATTVGNMFVDCHLLVTVPLYDLNGVTDTSGMFSNCFNLQSLPLFDMSTVLSTNTMCQNCNSLEEIPAWNLANATTLGASAFGSLGALSRFKATGMNATFSIASCNLSATELNEVYTNLSATGATKTITVTSNWGTATDNPAIATAKGWTVTG